MKRRSKQERLEIVEAYRRSGLTQEAFAAKHRINVGTLRSWLYRREESTHAAQSARFVEVEAAELQTGRVVLRVGEHVEVELDALPEPSYLAHLAQALGC